jgi:hypothetical protein
LCGGSGRCLLVARGEKKRRWSQQPSTLPERRPPTCVAQSAAASRYSSARGGRGGRPPTSGFSQASGTASCRDGQPAAFDSGRAGTWRGRRGRGRGAAHGPQAGSEPSAPHHMQPRAHGGGARLAGWRERPTQLTAQRWLPLPARHEDSGYQPRGILRAQRQPCCLPRGAADWHIGGPAPGVCPAAAACALRDGVDGQLPPGHPPREVRLTVAAAAVPPRPAPDLPAGPALPPVRTPPLLLYAVGGTCPAAVLCGR